MTLLQLLYFETLSRVLHYTRAAQELHISQPSLSYAMKELEKELGVKLFTRKDRRMVLTPYGQRFLPYVHKSLQLLENGRSALAEMSNEAELIVNLGYFHSIASSFIPSMIEAFYKATGQHKIHFQFLEDTSYGVLSKVKQGELDVGFCAHQDPQVASALVSKQPLYVVVPVDHPLVKKKAVTFNDFAQEPLIALSKGSSLRTMMDQAFAKRDIIPKIIFEVQECNAALRYVELNFGVSIVPEMPTLRTSQVVALPIAEHSAEFIRNVYLIWDPMRILSPSVTLVRDFIVQHYQEDKKEESVS